MHHGAAKQSQRGKQRILCHLNASSHEYAFADLNGYRYPYSDGYHDWYKYGYRNPNHHHQPDWNLACNTHPHQHSIGYRHCDLDGNVQAKCDRNIHLHGHGYAYGNRYRDSHIYSDDHTNSHSHKHRHGNLDHFTNTYSH